MPRRKQQETVYEVYDDAGNVVEETVSPEPGVRFNVKMARPDDVHTGRAHHVRLDDESSGGDGL